MPTWVVEVELASKSLDLLLCGEDSVEGVLAQDGHLPLAVVEVVLAQQLHDLVAYWRLHVTGGGGVVKSDIRGQFWLYRGLLLQFSHTKMNVLLPVWTTRWKQQVCLRNSYSFSRNTRKPKPQTRRQLNHNRAVPTPWVRRSQHAGDGAKAVFSAFKMFYDRFLITCGKKLHYTYLTQKL